MGVGAAIAAGNQGENGKIALFVINATSKKSTMTESGTTKEKAKKWGVEKDISIKDTIIKESPIRFINTVKSPEKIVDLDW